MTMMPGSLVTELSDDATDKLVEKALSGEEPTLISELMQVIVAPE